MSDGKRERQRLLDSYWGYARASEACAELAEKYGDLGEVYEVSEPGIRGLVDDDAGEYRVAHKAMLSCFSELLLESETNLNELRTRWPGLREEEGGPLPPTWAEFIESLENEEPHLRVLRESGDTSEMSEASDQKELEEGTCPVTSLDFGEDEDLS